MRRMSSFKLAALVLCAVASSAFGYWHWRSLEPLQGTNTYHENYYLTSNSGSHAVAMTEYYDDNSDLRAWTDIVAEKLWDGFEPGGSMHIHEYYDVGWPDFRHWLFNGDYWPIYPQEPPENTGPFTAVNCHVANNFYKKAFTWGSIHPGAEPHEDYLPEGMVNGTDNDQQDPDDLWDNLQWLTLGIDSIASDSGVAVALFRGGDAFLHGCVVWVRWDESEEHYTLTTNRTTNGGQFWRPNGGTDIQSTPDAVPRLSHPSIATNDQSGTDAYLAYDNWDGNDHIVQFRSAVRGEDEDPWTWSEAATLMDDATQPCVAALGPFVFVCAKTYDNPGRIV